MADNGSGQVVIKLFVSKISDEVKRAAPKKLDVVLVDVDPLVACGLE